MPSFSQRNDRKHHLKAIFYTLLLVGGLAALLIYSGQLGDLGSIIGDWFSTPVPEGDTPVAGA